MTHHLIESMRWAALSANLIVKIAVEDWCSDSALQQVPNTRHSMHMSAHLHGSMRSSHTSEASMQLSYSYNRE